jgi:hypothetical protein
MSRKTRWGLTINRARQFLVCGDVNLLGDNIDTIKKNTETLIDANGLEINVEKPKCMLLSRHQNVGQNRDIKIRDSTFENVLRFKYLGTTVTNQNLIQEEVSLLPFCPEPSVFPSAVKSLKIRI